MIKKLIATSILGIFTNAVTAADYVNLGFSSSKDMNTGKYLDVQYISAGKQINNLQYDLYSRVASAPTAGMYNNLEGTVGKSFKNVTPFIGVGTTQYVNETGPNNYNYGVVGAKLVKDIGLGTASLGVKTRILNTKVANTDETTVYSSYSMPLTNNTSLALNVSKSYQDLKKEDVGLSVNIKF